MFLFQKPLKMALIVRADLKLTKGKTASQTGKTEFSLPFKLLFKNIYMYG